MSGSESQSREVVLTCSHSKNATTTMNILCIAMKPVFVPTKISFTALIFIVNCLYKVSTESIRLVYNIKQFGTGSDLIVPTQGCTETDVFFFFLLCILVKTFHGFYRNTFEYFQRRLQHEI